MSWTETVHAAANRILMSSPFHGRSYSLCVSVAIFSRTDHVSTTQVTAPGNRFNHEARNAYRSLARAHRAGCNRKLIRNINGADQIARAQKQLSSPLCRVDRVPPAKDR